MHVPYAVKLVASDISSRDRIELMHFMTVLLEYDVHC